MKRYDVVATTVEGVTTTTIAPQATDSGYLSAAAAAFTSIPKIFGADGEKVLVTEKELGIASLTGMAVGFVGGDFWGHRSAAKGGKALVSRVFG